MKDIELAIGLRLKELREEKGLSQRDVGERLGCSHASIHCWKTGKRSILAKNLSDYCDILGVTLSEFFEGIEE